MPAGFSFSAGVAGCSGCVVLCTTLIPLMIPQFTPFFIKGTHHHGKETLHVLNIVLSAELGAILSKVRPQWKSCKAEELSSPTVCFSFNLYFKWPVT